MNETKLNNKIAQSISKKSKQTVQSSLPSQLRDLIMGVLHFINIFIIGFSYFILISQTVFIIGGKDPKYINLRHMMIKWLLCIIFTEIKRGFGDEKGVNKEILELGLNLCILFIAYPSKVLKTVHLKYFSHKQSERYNQSVYDPNNYDISFVNKLLISIVTLLLGLTKFLIAFIPPIHRKSVEEAIKSVNVLVIKKKSFWNIYEEKQSQIKDPFLQAQPSQFKQYVGSSQKNSISKSQTHIKIREEPPKDIIKANGEQCSEHTNSETLQKVYKAIKAVQIKYTYSTSDFEVTDLGLNRVDKFMLEEVAVISENVIEFYVLRPGQIYNEKILIKMRNEKEVDTFFRSIEEAENVG